MADQDPRRERRWVFAVHPRPVKGGGARGRESRGQRPAKPGRERCAPEEESEKTRGGGRGPVGGQGARPLQRLVLLQARERLLSAARGGKALAPLRLGCD